MMKNCMVKSGCQEEESEEGVKVVQYSSHVADIFINLIGFDRNDSPQDGQ